MVQHISASKQVNKTGSGGTIASKGVGAKEGQDIFQGVQGPQKVISFDHFVQENANFSWFHSN